MYGGYYGNYMAKLIKLLTEYNYIFMFFCVYTIKINIILM